MPSTYTLLEAAKIARANGEDFRAATIETFVSSTMLFELMPFDDIPGGVVKYDQEQTLPSVARRAVNEAYTPSTGVLNPATDEVKIIGGDIDVDRFIVQTRGPEHRAIQEAMKIKAVGHTFARDVIKGDAQTDPKQMQGLQYRLTGSQLIENDATTGAGLSLEKLDEAMDAVDNPGALLMTKAIGRKLTKAARNQSVGGEIEFTLDSFGRRVTTYNGVPLVWADENGNSQPALDFTEDSPNAGASNNTSIYVLDFSEGMLRGIRNGDFSVRDLGEVDDTPAFRTRVEFYAGIALYHPRAAARLYGITNADVTV